MSSKENKNVAFGHRARQRKQLFDEGASALSDTVVVEMLLYYAIPRSDTKQLAAELLRRFQTIDGILFAEPHEILAVPGIGESALVFLTLLREVVRRSGADSRYGCFFDAELAKEFVSSLFENAKTEMVFALYLDDHGSLLEKQLIFKGNISSAKFSLRIITEGAIRSGGNYVIIAHNHPSGVAIPSNDDIITTNRIAEYLSVNEITLVQHYIVASGGCTAIVGKISDALI